MIDIHSHLLPGIDDGAQTLDDALALARAAVAAGITLSVMTPHLHPGRYDNGLASIRAALDAFRHELALRGIPLTLRMGAEVRISPELVQMVEEEKVPYLGVCDGYSIVLLEFPHGHLTVGAEKLVEWLLARRVRPLIAHPERNKEVVRNVEKIRPYVAMGCLLQLTGASVIGRFGKPVQRCAMTLLERGWVAAVATDAHDLAHRPPNLDVARAALAAMGGGGWARSMTEHGPAHILGRPCA